MIHSVENRRIPSGGKKKKIHIYTLAFLFLRILRKRWGSSKNQRANMSGIRIREDFTFPKQLRITFVNLK